MFLFFYFSIFPSYYFYFKLPVFILFSPSFSFLFIFLPARFSAFYILLKCIKPMKVIFKYLYPYKLYSIHFFYNSVFSVFSESHPLEICMQCECSFYFQTSMLWDLIDSKERPLLHIKLP